MARTISVIMREGGYQNPFATHFSGPREPTEIARARSQHAEVLRESKTKKLVTLFNAVEELKGRHRNDLTTHFFETSPEGEKTRREIETLFIADLEIALHSSKDIAHDSVIRYLRGLIRVISNFPPSPKPLELDETLKKIDRDFRLKNEAWKQAEADLTNGRTGEDLESAAHTIETVYNRLNAQWRVNKDDPKTRELLEREMDALRGIRDLTYSRRLYPQFHQNLQRDSLPETTTTMPRRNAA